MVSTGPTADDLDDGLEYDVEFSDTEQSGVPLEEDGFENDADDDEDSEINNGSEISSKRKRKPESNFKEKKKQKMELDMETKKNMSLESNPEIITEYINNKIRKKNIKLSALELTELYFNKSDIRSSSDFKETRNLDNLSKFIISKFSNILPSGKSNKNKKSKKKGKNFNGEAQYTEDSEGEKDRKFIAVVSMSAIRACDIHRATKDLPGSSLKLINKNKLEVDLKLVKTTKARILCCTPGRIIKVLNNEDAELKKSEIKIIIIDNSYLDKKKQNIWDIPESFQTLKELTRDGSKLYLY
ncbi:unnamed protein product [Candida verbasci]|uniref:Protein CMS1 n=1 Tax=Candida verbasci TaxID=1227364 RepID=A0A9W4TT26_9ASCO|nr:unnamed protein product [Candida verbasci]